MKLWILLTLFAATAWRVPLCAGARTIFLDSGQMVRILVRPGRTVILNFPTTPGDFVLGGDDLFSIKHIKNDLAIGALRSTAQSNLFVYLEGRRFGFELETAAVGWDEIVNIRDPSEIKMKVHLK